MIDIAVAGKLSALLQMSSRHLCDWLFDSLPKLDQAWWSALVLPNLSFQQRQRVEQNGITSLSQFDLAALLRILDRNWYEISSRFNLTNQDRNFVKEMQTVRNRWAHMDAHGVDADDVYRDVDTLQRFLKAINAPSGTVDAVKQVKEQIRNAAAPEPEVVKEPELEPAVEPVVPEEPAVESPPSNGIGIGSLVALVSNPEKTGAVMSIDGSDETARYTVFLDGRPQPFYAPQLQLAEQVSDKNLVKLSELHSLLTGLQIRHPSLSTLYSLNAARIDFVPYQFRPALKIIQSDQPRLLIADSVGVGKTIEAGLILRELQARSNVESVLIICPKPLVAERKWELEMKRFDERFVPLDGKALQHCIHETELDGEWPDSHGKAILPYSLLQDEGLLHGKTNGRKKQIGLLDLDPPPKFDLVIVDEAHHVRNSNTFAHQAVSYFCEHAEAVVFLTATPVQMGNNDLYTLLNLLRPDLVIDPETFEHMAEPNPHINNAVNLARAGGENWQENTVEALQRAADTAWGKSILRNNPGYQALIEELGKVPLSRADRVALVRQMEGFHSFSRLINRTRRRDIGAFCTRKPETVAVEFTVAQKKLHDDLLEFQAKALTLMHGAQNIQFMMSTIRRQAASCIFGLAPFITDILQRRLSELEWLESSDDSGDLPEFVKALENEALDIVGSVKALSPEDPKFDALLRIVTEKIKMPNNKLMVFSTFRHTLAYLERKLRQGGIRVGMVHGNVKDEDRLVLRNRFEMHKEDSDTLDVLLFSEVGCEGLDYQFCDMMVNYDLPWNPMRIEQRIGRIDRRGQKSEAVAIYNMITPGTVDADIYNRCLSRIGIFEDSIGECEEILGAITREIRNIADNLELSEEERQSRLEQLADNEVRNIQEQQKLEEREHELFGLRLPNNAPDAELQASESYWLSMASLQRFVHQYLNQRLGKADYILGDKPLKTVRLSQEARSKLLEDYRKLPGSKTPMFRDWEKWLKGAEPHAVITFDSSCAADHREALFVMPLHPLVKQAARYLDVAEPVHTALRVQDADLASGSYPFAIYAWEIKGLRPELRLVPVCNSDEIRQGFFDCLESGASIDPSTHLVPDEEIDSIDKVHHRLWEQEKAEHQAKTAEMVRFRQESLETSHRGRINVIEKQIDNATNAKIRKMKEAQLNNVQADYERKRAELQSAESAADIHARPVVFGTLVVEA
ncbi:RNA polymerase-associated protein RapA [Pontiella desulfatans]|uniref:RNA polymerase-associated protein RapA n=1 Tax=Pontiella desulfatans TaxID=2750659 RepID=A0A6C2UBV2_PONDE|nr:helicase-related protein [Pontiella desulfatans]VGO17570.1 RNA polymerase-associated protein RapA [Pontiella desulfatans]